MFLNLRCFTEDKSQSSKELKFALSKDIDTSKLDPLELSTPWDPTATKFRPRKSAADRKTAMAKLFKCNFCKWEATYSYAKFHDS